MAANFNNLCRDLIGSSLRIKGKLVIDTFCNITTNNTLQAAQIIGDFCGNAQVNKIGPKTPNGFFIFDGDVISEHKITVDDLVVCTFQPMMDNTSTLGSPSNCWLETFTTSITTDLIQTKTTGFLVLNGSLEPFETGIFNLGTTTKCWGETFTTNLTADLIQTKTTGFLAINGSPEPLTTEIFNLGSISKCWGETFTTNLTADLIQTKGGGFLSINGSPEPLTTEIFNLGSTSKCWGETFTTNITTDLIQTKTTGFLSINGSLEPLQGNIFDIGSPGKLWSNIYTTCIFANCIEPLIDGKINVAGNLCLLGNVSIIGGNLTTNIVGNLCGSSVTTNFINSKDFGNIIINGNIITNSNVTINGTFTTTSNLIPQIPKQTLGSNSNCWAELYVSNITTDYIQTKTTGFLTINGSIEPFGDNLFNIGSNVNAYVNLFAANISTDCISTINTDALNIKANTTIDGNVCITGSLKYPSNGVAIWGTGDGGNASPSTSTANVAPLVWANVIDTFMEIESAFGDPFVSEFNFNTAEFTEVCSVEYSIRLGVKWSDGNILAGNVFGGNFRALRDNAVMRVFSDQYGGGEEHVAIYTGIDDFIPGSTFRMQIKQNSGIDRDLTIGRVEVRFRRLA